MAHATTFDHALHRDLAGRDAEAFDRVDKLARLLDSRFRVLGVPFGYDAILGLLPGVGDAASLGISTYILAEGWRMGARKRAIAKMGFNVLGDAVLGSIPLLGTIIDVGWKANRRNVDILKRELSLPGRRRRD